METIESIFGKNRYPGRGVLIGSLGARAVTAYFITARSENSRNRVFREEGDSLAIHPFDESLVSDPRLIFYTPLRVCADSIVLSNGDQTDTICESLLSGHSLQYAMSTRCYEPDAPNHTPRIAGLALPTGRYTLGIVRKAGDAPDCRRKYWSYDPKEGAAHLICTYDGDGDPLPSFSGEPLELEIGGTPEELTERIWNALDAENRVSLYVRYTDLNNGRFDSAMKNRRLGD
ncbi:MAG: inosine monophosphate cyclohydrolase [Clostridiales bacterium]|nr:inosine monophosphate cyclohydrolase [Clostridiales bacterium]